MSWSLHCTGHGDGDRQIRGVKGMVSGYLDIRSLPHFPPDHSVVLFSFFVFNFCLCTGLVISILSPYFSFLFFGVYDWKEGKIMVEKQPVKNVVTSKTCSKPSQHSY